MYEIKEIKEKPANWNVLVTHPLQAWEWGTFREKMGIDILRLGVYENDQLVDGYQISFHPLPHLPYTVGYFPKGPLPTKEMVDVLLKFGKRKRAVFIQLEPNIEKSEKSASFDQPLRPSHHPLFTKYTFTLDLTKSEDDLLKAMHSKTRYNIKVAQKHSIEVREDNSEKAFEEYLRLEKETTQRQRFYAHSERYHRRMWETLSKTEIAKLFTATYQGKCLAAWIMFGFHDVLYYPYGASSREYRETMAPTLMLWEIAKWGKANGYKTFDLWGAMGPTPDENDPWYGFHRFKTGFTPRHVEFVGSYDLVVQPILYPLYCFADTIRWTILRAKRA